MDSILSIPFITPFMRYLEWKLKMIASLKRQGLYEVSIGIHKESYEDENEWLNDGDRGFGIICTVFSPRLCYLIDSTEYPKDLWIELNRTFGKKNEDHYSNLESTPNITRVIYSKLFASIISDEFFQDEEEAESSTQSIQIEESLLAVTPSPDAPKFCEISDI